MAELSNFARNFLKNHKRKLQNNDLSSLYKDLLYEDDSVKLEISEFLYDVLGDRIFSYLNTIPKNFFRGSKVLKDISIPNSVSAIGENAFSDSSIQKISLNSGVEGIGDSAFKNCTNLQTVDLGEVKFIKNEAFAGCSRLRQIYLPESVVMIGKNAFPDDVILTSPRRKAKSLRFPKNELEWYKNHLVLDSSQYEEKEEE